MPFVTMEEAIKLIELSKVFEESKSTDTAVFYERKYE